jgi:hypothetical protein
MKTCSKCNEDKDISEFHKNKSSKDGLKSSCKICRNKDNIIRSKSESAIIKNKEYREVNREKLKAYKDNYYKENQEVIKQNAKKYYIDNKEHINTRNINYSIENKETISKYQKDYYNSNRDSINNYKREYANDKYKNNYTFKLKCSISSLIRMSIKAKGFNKKLKSIDILGCNIDEFKLYIESKFEPWMTWENKGLYNGQFNYGWDIDHIIPMSSGNTEVEIINLNNYKNLQPLCSKINRDIKRDKLEYEMD